MGKYEYEQSWEKSQRDNPKLNIKEYINTSSSLVIQTWIANELAEANRLKRLKLMATDKLVHNYTHEEYVKEIEDKA